MPHVERRLTKSEGDMVKQLRALDYSYCGIEKQTGIRRGAVSQYCHEQGIARAIHPNTIAANRRNGVKRSEEARVRNTCICQQCEKEYIFDRYDAPLRLLFCSTECLMEYTRDNPTNPNSNNVYFLKCAECEKLFTARRKEKKCCSKVCTDIWLARLTKAWRIEHREEQNEKMNYKLRHSPKLRLQRAVSGYVWRTLKGKKRGKRTFELLGYSVGDLMSHLEGLFHSGMSWKNYGKWHIDHTIPVSVFNFTKATDIDFKRCWALNNLQPMWGKENISKGSRLDKPFQPSLAIGYG